MPLIHHNIILRGPFTEEDVRTLLTALRAIEARHPEDTDFHIDFPDAANTPPSLMKQFLDRVWVEKPGYARITTTVELPKEPPE